MTDKRNPIDTAAPTNDSALKRDSLSWLGAGLLGAIIMSPASGLYFNFAPTEAAAGKIVPFIFLVAMLVTLPTALSYSSMSRSVPSSGSAFTWMHHAVGPASGVFAGWILNGFYLLAQVVLPGIGALYFNQILAQIGIPTGYLTWAIGVVVMCLVVVAFNYRGIELSLKTTVIFMITESVIVFALMATILVVTGHNGTFSLHQATQTFSPGTAVGGSTAIFAALVFGIQGNVGFDAVAGMAEETRSPRRAIPIATVCAVVGVGIYWMVTGIGFSAALPLGRVVQIVDGGQATASVIAQKYWGSVGQMVISIIAFSSILAIFLSQNIASSRSLYAMARRGAAPRWLGVVHESARVPRHAMTLGLVVTTVVTLALGAWLGTANQYNWTATMSSSLALLTYLGVNISNFVYHWRFSREHFNWFLHAAAPLSGIVVVCFVIDRSYLGSLWNSGWTYGKSVQLAVVVWLIAGVAWVVMLRKKRPEVFAEQAVDRDSAALNPTAGPVLVADAD